MKTIPLALATHKAQPSTTLTDLNLIGPLPDDSYIGLTNHDRNIVFTPAVSIGEMTFYARTGMQMSAFQSGNDLGVNNAEAQTLLPVATFELEGITQQQIDSGALDRVRFVILRVNYKSLSDGAEIIAGGTLGEIRQKVGGLTVMELRSLTQMLKQQNLIELDSIDCRAIFGSQPWGTGGGVVEEEFACGFDASALWVTGTITSVGGDTLRQFADTSLIGSGTDYFQFGKIEILDGDNAGQVVEIDSYDDTSGVVELRFETVTPLVVGVGYRIRPGCSKRWTGHNSCQTWWGADKTLHYRGEPAIPVGNSAALQVPGAGIAQGLNGGGPSSSAT
jgi:uncharacterized phage protein (TIGR02218 family)